MEQLVFTLIVIPAAIVAAVFTVALKRFLFGGDSREAKPSPLVVLDALDDYDFHLYPDLRHPSQSASADRVSCMDEDYFGPCSNTGPKSPRGDSSRD